MTQANPRSGAPVPSKHLYSIANWALLAAGLVNLAVGTHAAIAGDATIAATSLTAGLVLLFAATIDRFESFKGLGVEAKTRQLDAKLNQADDALRRLREMTEITGAALVDLNSKMGRIGSAPGPRESIALAERVRQIMTSLGSDTATVQKALRPWARILCFDASRAVVKDLEPLIRSRMEALERQRQAIPMPIAAGDQAFEQVTRSIAALHEYKERTRRFGSADLDEYPEALLSLFDSFPGDAPPQLAAVRNLANQLAPGMRSLKESQTLTDPEFWIATIDQARDR